MPYLLELTGVCKTFGPSRVLQDARFDLCAGEVHALVGENGAGKSTLMKILSGVHRKESGTIVLEGREIEPSSPTEARRLGIGTVFQELSLCPNLTVAENIFANREPSRFGLVRKRKLNAMTEEHLRAFGVQIPADATLGELNIAKRQIVEILKAVSLSAKVLILDEPTSSLEQAETERLFALLDRLRRDGTGIVFISHKLSEVFRIADRITVFRDGRHILTRPTPETSHDEVIRSMIGRDLRQTFPPKAAGAGGVRLAVQGLKVRDLLSDISFSVREHEILGVAGLTGAGRTETMQSVFGARRRDAGTVAIDGAPVTIASPADAIAAGLFYSPEDRKDQGLFLNHSINLNIAASSLEACSTSGIMSKQREAALGDRMVRDLAIKASGLDQEAGLLSGGNQQKVLLARCLAAGPRVLIVDEPTRGIDIGAKIEIYALLRDYARQGGAVVMISSELPELIGLCDRVIVFKAGRITGEVSGDITENEILRLMMH